MAETWPLKCVVGASPVITIPAAFVFGANAAGWSPFAELARLLLIGREYHEPCRETFVERVQTGYYAWEIRMEWRTCSVAAAYAGLRGPRSIEKDFFSYTQAVWELNQHLGFELDQVAIVGPTGRRSTVYDEMILLTDANLWTRRGVAQWLPKVQVVRQ